MQQFSTWGTRYQFWQWEIFLFFFVLFRLQNFVKRLLPSCLSDRPHGTRGSHVTDFREIWYLIAFRKSVEKIKFCWNLTKIRHFTCRPIYIFDHISLRSSIMRSVSHKSCTETPNKHFMFNNVFFWKSCHLWDNVGRCGTAGQATDGNMAHAYYILGNKGYTHTHSEYVILVFPQRQW